MSLQKKLEKHIYYNPITHGALTALYASKAIIDFGSGDNLAATFMSAATLCTAFSTVTCCLWDGNRSKDNENQDSPRP